MAHKFIPNSTERTPEEKARLRAVREQFLREKPAQDDLESQGHVFLPLGEVLGRQALVQKLRDERKQQGLTLRELSEMTGIDEPALSRLETGKNTNPTLDTLDRVAAALGKVISCFLQDKGS
jgi:DNA-binding Xre family transcriptional regulator